MDSLITPSLKKRLASMLYESMLLFGVVFISNWLFSTLLEQRHALQFRHAGQIWLFLVLALYFTWFWSHGRQTLAMKTWRIKLVTANGTPVGFWRAFLRYILAWLWFIPGLALAWLLGMKEWMSILMLIANMVAWAMTIYLDPKRNFLHDRLAGTRLVLLPTQFK